MLDTEVGVSMKLGGRPRHSSKDPIFPENEVQRLFTAWWREHE